MDYFGGSIKIKKFPSSMSLSFAEIALKEVYQFFGEPLRVVTMVELQKQEKEKESKPNLEKDSLEPMELKELIEEEKEEAPKPKKVSQVIEPAQEPIVPLGTGSAFTVEEAKMIPMDPELLKINEDPELLNINNVPVKEETDINSHPVAEIKASPIQSTTSEVDSQMSIEPTTTSEQPSESEPKEMESGTIDMFAEDFEEKVINVIHAQASKQQPMMTSHDGWFFPYFPGPSVITNQDKPRNYVKYPPETTLLLECKCKEKTILQLFDALNGKFRLKLRRDWKTKLMPDPEDMSFKRYFIFFKTPDDKDYFMRLSEVAAEKYRKFRIVCRELGQKKKRKQQTRENQSTRTRKIADADERATFTQIRGAGDILHI